MSELGIANNIANFETLISFVQAYGAAYSPSNSTIALSALQAKYTSSENAVNGVSSAVAPWKVKVNERETAYEGLRRLVTRVFNNFAASGVDQNAIDDAKSIKRKIDGARAKALPKDDPETPEDESSGNSVSQRSYTQTVEHFDNLIAFLSNYNTFYDPNENELKLSTLSTKSAQLKSANEAVTATATPLSNARITRDAELYTDKTGLVDLAGLVKKYVKSVYGATSPQFKQISGLAFRKMKKVKGAPGPPIND